MLPDNANDVDTICVLGDDLLGVAAADAAAAQQIAAQLRQYDRWLEVVAGIDSVAVRFDLAATGLTAARDQLADQLRATVSVSAVPAALVEIPVCYGGDFGPDLDAVCKSLDVSIEKFIDLHVSGEYTVDMLGFTPGFAYIGGLPAALDVPRLAEPRQHVAAGSIGIADRRSGVYTMAGPGGWPLIGRTPLQLFDAAAPEPFLLSAGTRIRFQPIDAQKYLELERS